MGLGCLLGKIYHNETIEMCMRQSRGICLPHYCWQHGVLVRPCLAWNRFICANLELRHVCANVFDVGTKQTFQQTKNICITCVQRRPNDFDVGPKLYKFHTKFRVCWDVF